MNSKKRILISILLVLIILSTNIAATLAATKSELQNKQNSINQQIKDTENEISAVKEEMSDTMKQIQDLNTQISGYQSEIDDLEYKISDLEKDIEESQEKLNEAEKNYNKQEEAFKNRIVAQYEAGETTYLDVLLGGGSLWDMVSNWYVVSEIADLDNQMLGQMEKNKNEIEEAKKALETNKEQIEVTKKNKEQKASALKSSQATKEQYVNELSDNDKIIYNELYNEKLLNKTLIELTGYHSLRTIITKVYGSDVWNELKDNMNFLDELALYCTNYKINEEILKKIKESEYIDSRFEDMFFIEKLPNFKDHLMLSTKLIRKLIPLMLEGNTYDKAMSILNYNHSNAYQEQIKKDLLVPICVDETITNQRVIRSLTQTRKVINSIIKKYGLPKMINIETARELAKSRQERNEIEKSNLEKQVENEKIKNLLEKGNENKYLTYKEINNAIDNVDADVIDILFQLLNARNIATVEDKKEFDNIVKEHSKSDSSDKFIHVEEKVGNNDDPIRLYLKEIGKVNLLTHDDEVEFSKKIEAGESEIEGIVLNTHLVVGEVLTTIKNVHSGRVSIHEILEPPRIYNVSTHEKRKLESSHQLHHHRTHSDNQRFLRQLLSEPLKGKKVKG